MGIGLLAASLSPFIRQQRDLRQFRGKADETFASESRDLLRRQVRVVVQPSTVNEDPPESLYLVFRWLSLLINGKQFRRREAFRLWGKTT